tara:strand:+ start:4409 stop:5104 length:696 start_codon:yes stop_codon:yes gene_type:complete
MATTLNKIVYDVLETVQSHVNSNNSDIDVRQVEWLINNQRALLIRNEYNKPGRVIDHNLIQDLGCVEVEMVDNSACPEISTSGCYLLRTKCQIPNTIELHHKTAITRVGSPDRMNDNYSFVPYDQAVYSGNGKFNKDSKFAFLLNNYVYIKVHSKKSAMLKYVNIRGIFEDPTELNTFTCCTGETCYTSDSPYPINTWMIPYMKEPVINQLLMAQQLPEDNSNNAASDESK